MVKNEDEILENLEQQKTAPLLSVHDLEVKFRVRDRMLNAIRGISLDIYSEESIAIVGPSAGNLTNCDIMSVSGWGPDFGDPDTYLGTFTPGPGGMLKCSGLF